MRPSVPPYFDALIAAHRAGQVGPNVHLGYWDNPPSLLVPCGTGEFGAAQDRLTQRTIDLAALARGQRLLDVGCGFGGTIAAAGARVSGVEMTGVNIDPRQLAICRTVPPGPGNSLTLVEADAAALPFSAASFDRVFCVEAMFHFASRAAFLAEVARVLRPGGLLTLSDILAVPPALDAPWDQEQIEEVLRRDYGPWPEIWTDAQATIARARDADLILVTIENWSANTLPAYRVTAPPPGREPSWNPGAGEVMRWLHETGYLRYEAMVFRRL